MHLEPVIKKPKLYIDSAKCLFCYDPFNPKNKKGDAVTPNKLKLDNLFQSARDRQDDTAALLLQNEENIRNGNIKISYHRTCRSVYIMARDRKLCVGKHENVSEINGNYMTKC